MRLWTVALIVELVGWVGYIVFYNGSSHPAIVAQRKTVRPWLVALMCLFWPFLFAWSMSDWFLSLVGRLGRKERT
jgi:hypothetical protein